MLTRSKQAALQEIRRWTVEDVLAVLEKNGLGDCADVVKKREVVGEMLLQLTEGKLALWKRDINQNKIRTLAAFVEDLKMHPEKYLIKENCSCDHEHFPEGGFSPTHGRCNSAGSDSSSRLQDSNSRNDKDQKLKVAAAFLSEIMSQSGRVAGNSHDDLLPSTRLKPPDKPPILSRPKNFQAGAVKVTAIKVFPPKPPNHLPYETTQFPARDLVASDSSENDNVLQDHKSEENNEQPMKRATSPSTRSVPVLEENSSHEDSLLQDGVKCPYKPALLKKPINVKPNQSTLHDKAVHLKPHNPQSSKLKNFSVRDGRPSDVISSSSRSNSVSPRNFPASDLHHSQEATSITVGNIPQPETNGVNSQIDSIPSDGLKSTEKLSASRYPKETKDDAANTTNKKELLPKPPSHPNLPLRRIPSCSSGSDTASWDTDFEDSEPTKEIPCVDPTRLPHSEAVGNSQTDLRHQGEATSLEKPSSCSEHNVVQTDVILPHSDELLLPKPPSQSSEIISTVNIGAIEAKIWAEQLDEEFYESLDGENIADIAALKAAVLNQNDEKKLGTKNVSSLLQADKIRAENNHQTGISCTENMVTTSAKRSSLPPLSDMRETAEPVRSESPPTPPPRNPTMKLNEADAVMNRLHSSSSSLREESLRQRNNFFLSSETGSAATSHQSSMSSLNNLNTGSTKNSYLHFSQSSPTFPEPNSDAEYEILDNRAHITSDSESAFSEVYESIKEQGPRGMDEDGYYLQPDPRLPKNDESSSDDSRHLPLPPKSKATLPDVVLPSAPPPSPPRKKSEDSSSSTTSGSGDSMSGRFGGLFRKVISRPQPLLPDHSEKVSPGTPELKKPCSLPPPTTRPPPPVEQRSSAFQRPLPPTPEGKKFQLPSPDKSHNTIPHQITPVSFRQMPWFHNIDRQRAEELLRNGEDGCFVVRPSTQTANPLTLTLWYKNRIFNICIRHRKDGKYALGTEKINEQSFDSIEEMVTNYQSEKLVLYSAGERAGKVLLTSSPRRSS